MRHGKKYLSLILALALVLGMLTIPAFADEAGQAFTYTDGYTLVLGGDGTAAYAYYSPYVPELTYDGYPVDGYSILFGLKDTTNGTILENAYCTDMPVDAVTGAHYRRLNLTDSTYAATHADKLRAIVLGSYPHLSLSALQTASKIDTLTAYQAITATQLAIWKTAHGEAVQVTDFLSYTTAQSYTNGSAGHTDEAQKEYNTYNSGSDEYKAQVKANIEALYNYLMGLEGRSATSTTVSRASFTSRSTSPSVTENEDGTYDVTVSTTIKVSGGDLTLTAYIGDYYSQVNATSSTHTLTIKNVPAELAFQPVTLSLDGTQDVGTDVFLLDAEGIRGVSQSLIAPLSGTLPVHADVKCEPDRVLEIYKTAGGSALANISFEVYYVGSLEDYLNGDLGIGTKPTSGDITTYGKTSNLVGTITTNSSGYGSLNFGTDDGVYLVKELPNELITDSVAFFVTLPDYSRCDENGNPSYTITAQAKNSLQEEKVEIEKDVTKLDNEHDTYDVGENHTWIVQSSIPYGIGTGKSYTVSDTLDSRLTLVSVDKVSLAKDNGTFGNSEDTNYKKDESETPLGSEETVLTEGTDFVLTTGKTEDGNDTFTLSLTATGRRKIAEVVKKDSNTVYELRIAYTAYINSTATMGGNIPNQAHVSYTNNLDKTYEKGSDQPEVHTGGTKLLKVDKENNNRPLAGATFQVYRMATPEEVAAKDYDKMIQVGETSHEMVLVSFYNNTTCTGDKVNELTTGDDGIGYIYGLAYGEYYLVETKAPDGYNKLRQAVKFTIDATSHTEDGKLKVENTTGTELPETGGIGTLPFTLTGTALLLCAAWLLLKRKIA